MSSIVLEEPVKTVQTFPGKFITEPSCDVARHMLGIAEQESVRGDFLNARRDFKTVFLHYRTIAYHSSAPIPALLGLSALYRGEPRFPSLHVHCLAVTNDSSNVIKHRNLLQYLRINMQPFRAGLPFVDRLT